jgi:hypothetical protein
MRSEGSVWCAKCHLRIAPCEAQTVYRRNKYHQDCFLKLVREEADQEKTVRYQPEQPTPADVGRPKDAAMRR